MKFHKKFSTFLALFSVIVFVAGCNCFSNSGAKPSNPFAQNQQTVPPPGTFSSQEAFLGQTPGSYVPQTPAMTFPSTGSVPSTPPATPPPSNITLSDTISSSGEKATLFTPAEKEPAWTAVDVATTSKTAFQATDARVTGGGNAIPNDTSESLVVGTSHVVTTITDESAVSTEPSLLLYSGGFSE
jgi:hypothetical protein